MRVEMSRRVGAIGLMMVWFYAGHCMGLSTPRNVVTHDYYKKLKAKVPGSCPGKTFYTYHSFVTAAEKAHGFGTSGSDEVRKREVAAFFAHVMHETGDLCHIKERKEKRHVYCNTSYTQWPCAPGRSYFGRGPLQLTWNYNYGAAGKALGFNGLKDPDTLAKDPLKSFGAAFWFWMHNECHNATVNGKGFGATIRAINSHECGGGNLDHVNSRVKHYRKFCSDFAVDPGANISC